MERKEIYIAPACEHIVFAQQSLVCTSVSAVFEELAYGEGDPSLE